MLIAVDLKHDLSGPWMVQLNKKDALVISKLHIAVDEGYSLARAQQKMLQVSMTVRRFVGCHIDGPNREIVVLIAAVTGREFL